MNTAEKKRTYNAPTSTEEGKKAQDGILTMHRRFVSLAISSLESIRISILTGSPRELVARDLNNLILELEHLLK